MILTIDIPDDLLEIGELIRTQNNRITDQPLFAVRRRVKHICPEGYEDATEWVETESGDYCTADEKQAAILDRMEAKGKETGKWEKFYYRYDWEFVTGCFTEQGCKDHIAMNGHNISGQKEIYAYGSYRNPEFQAVRKFLMSLPQKEST